MFGRRCFQLRHLVSILVGAVSNCANAVRLETAPTGVIARIFFSPVQSVQLILNFTIVARNYNAVNFRWTLGSGAVRTLP